MVKNSLTCYRACSSAFMAWLKSLSNFESQASSPLAASFRVVARCRGFEAEKPGAVGWGDTLSLAGVFFARIFSKDSFVASLSAGSGSFALLTEDGRLE